MKQLKPTHKTKAGIEAEVYEFDPYAKPDWFCDMIKKGQAQVFKMKDGTYTAKLGNKRGMYTAFIGDYIVRDIFGHVHVVSQKTFASRYERV